jgi:hypothetical protein
MGRHYAAPMDSDLATIILDHVAADEMAATKAPDALNDGEWPFWPDVDDQHEYEAACAWRDAFRPDRMMRQATAIRAIVEKCQMALGGAAPTDDAVAAVAAGMLTSLAGIWESSKKAP